MELLEKIILKENEQRQARLEFYFLENQSSD
jgi:hypothetical protein